MSNMFTLHRRRGLFFCQNGRATKLAWMAGQRNWFIGDQKWHYLSVWSNVGNSLKTCAHVKKLEINRQERNFLCHKLPREIRIFGRQILYCLWQFILNLISVSGLAENTHQWGKYQCMADLHFYKFLFNWSTIYYQIPHFFLFGQIQSC